MPDPIKKHEAPRTIRHSSRRMRTVARDDDDNNLIPELTTDPFEDAFAVEDEGIAERRRDPLRH